MKRTFVRTVGKLSAGISLVLVVGACGGEGPMDPENGPTLTDITPSSGAVRDRATTVTVGLTGTGFNVENVEVRVSDFDGASVEVADVYVYNDTYLTADFIIPGGMATGNRDVTVSTDAGTSGSVSFQIGRDATDYKESRVIEIHDNYPAPTYLTVEAGQPVLFRNVGANEHTVQTYGNPGLWDAALLKPDQRFTLTFYEEGVYGYMCGIHQSIGFITVVDPGSTMDPEY